MKEKNKVSDTVKATVTSVTLNEKTMSEEDFEKEKQRVEDMPNAEIVEVKKGEFRTKLQD